MKILYQGIPGAYSHLACLEVFPKADAIACSTFEEAFQLVKDSSEYKIVIPIENSLKTFEEKLFSEKSWDEKFPILKFWGSDEEQKPDDEFRYRIRISPMDDVSKVFLDLPNGSLNNSKESQQIIKIIFEQLK